MFFIMRSLLDGKNHGKKETNMEKVWEKKMEKKKKKNRATVVQDFAEAHVQLHGPQGRWGEVFFQGPNERLDDPEIS